MLTLRKSIYTELIRETPAHSLAFFRILFGLMIFGGTLRFMLKGWVDSLYVKPTFYFNYWGFEFVKPLPEWATYGLFILLALSALMVALGCYYRLSSIVLFLSFGYTELIDKTNYLNHYYFVSLMAFVIIFLPMHSSWSIDAMRKPGLRRLTVPNWMLLAIKMQLGIVYFFGGIAKIKYDWLIMAQPLKIWLSASTDFPVIGFLLDEPWAAYSIAWIAMLFDLTVPFFLFSNKYRPYAYTVVVLFHLLTAKLFYIGMFPYIMMTCTLVFFSPAFHGRILNGILRLGNIFGIRSRSGYYVEQKRFSKAALRIPVMMLGASLLFQLIMPFRYAFYPNSLCWSEEGFRYSWNIMLVEKTGFVEFNIKDKKTGKTWVEVPGDYLTPYQVKMLSTQPDMILQFAHFLHDNYAKKGQDVAVMADCYVSLNGRPSQLLINLGADLAKETEGLHAKTWILPLKEDRTLAGK
jgi:hypothetical protein